MQMPYPMPMGFPHLVVERPGVNERWEITVTNERVAELERPARLIYYREGAIDGAGRLTDIGRQLVLSSVRDRMRLFRSQGCIVWGPRECTYVSAEQVLDGDDPPIGEPADSGDWRSIAAVDVEGAHLTLPGGSASSHIFLRRLAPDRVEVSSGAPMVIGRYQDGPRSDEADPFGGCIDGDGHFVPPRRFRGVEVTGVSEHEDELLGPVQPDGRMSLLVKPWPHLVNQACIQIAGRPLPAELLSRAWRAIEDGRHHLVVCGVRAA